MGSGLLRRTSIRPIITLLSDILLSKFPQFKVEKLKMKICKGFPIRRVQTQAYHLNIGLELGLDLDLHYSRILSVARPSSSTRIYPSHAHPGSQKVEAETFILARVTPRSDISPFQISVEIPISLRNESACQNCIVLSSYVNKIFHYSNIHTEMNLSFHGFISNN